MNPDTGEIQLPRTARPDDDTTQVVVLESNSTRPAPAAPERDRCALSLLSGQGGGSLYTVDADELVFGRGSEAGARVQDASLSRRHARVYRRGGGFYLEDLGSTNGTYLNGASVKVPARLEEGDRVQMGGTVLFRVHLQDEVEQEATRRLYESAVRDPLTQVHNRRYLDERLLAEFAYARRHLSPLTVILLDIDFFKRVNDTAGHLAGDAVLRVVAGTMQRMLRTEDLVARYGGEEFCVLARGIDQRNATILGERIRRKIEALQIPWEGGTLRVTVSAGIATMAHEHPYPSVQALIAAADTALYRAKEAGRNRCCS